MEVTNYKKKLKTLFDKFTQKNYHLRPYYPKAIVKYFENCSEKSIEKQLLDTAFFSDLVLSAVLNVEKIPCTAIKTFLLEIVTILVKNELQYCKLMYLYGFKTIVSKMSSIGDCATSHPDYQLAFIKFPTAMIFHSPGLLTIVEQKSWLYVLTPNTHHRPVMVARSIYKFISQLVWKLNELEEEQALTELLQYVITPLMSKYQLTPIIEVENEKTRSEQLISFLQAFLAIFDATTNLMKPNIVMHLLKRRFLIQAHLHYLLQTSRDDDVQIILTESLFRYFVALYIDSAVGKSDKDFLNEVMSSYNNIISYLIHMRMVKVLITFIVKCVIYWSKLDSTVEVPQTFELNGQKFDMRNQLVLLVVVPILTYASYCKNENNFSDTFYLKFTAISTEHIVKSHYKYKALIESSDIKKICLQSLRETFLLTGYLNVSQAGIIYQALYYALECHVSTDGSGCLVPNGNFISSYEDIRILSLVLDLMLKVLQVHQINWYDSIEIICFQNTLMNTVVQNIFPTKLLIQALNLVDLSIKKFLSPDLTLLVETRNGSTLDEIVKMVQTYLHHEEWEVRDSALQIVSTCTEISYIKYVPLQKLILQNNLIVEAARIGLNDVEFYVQATAFKCLAAATRIDVIWREVLLVHPHLYYQLAYVLRHNPEGIVRVEVANVLTELYVNQRLSQVYIKPLYAAMTISAIDDLHWEVQLAALNFWKHVIQTLLSDRGMIDGKFPSVTFSKEKRKIITLNDSEIIKQLTFLMENLSSSGCLTVLYECLNEDCNITVMEQAYLISKDLIQILDNYKFHLPNPSDAQSQNVQSIIPDKTLHFHNDEDSIVMDERDIIIDKITSTNYAELIEEMCQTYVAIKSEDGIDNHSMQAQRKIIQPHNFIVNFKQTDYSSILKNKANWNLSNLDTLLDEILNLDDESDNHDICRVDVNGGKKFK